MGSSQDVSEAHSTTSDNTGTDITHRTQQCPSTRFARRHNHAYPILGTTPQLP